MFCDVLMHSSCLYSRSRMMVPLGRLCTSDTLTPEIELLLFGRPKSLTVEVNRRYTSVR